MKLLCIPHDSRSKAWIECAKRGGRSGTEDQYTEKEQILQDLSDYARAVQYEPRIAPRSAGCAVRWKKPGTAHDASRTSRAAQERRGASQLDELAGDCSYLAEPASQICVAVENDGSPAAQLFLSVYDEKLVLGPSAATSDNERDRMDGGQQQQSQVMSVQQEHPPSAPSSVDNDQREPATRQQILPAMGKGIRGLQRMGLQLLTMRETNEFHLRNKELAIERRKVENEERRLALEECKLELEEKKLQLESSSREANQQKVFEQLRKKCSMTKTKNWLVF
ncbi:hypothetical protein V5799_023336 [Amblyomma americanum]|uniref:Uncharacterized protein n=1 Tax=Amblyomma americanum TaxID=6943 RepID=A0AAQ4FJY9_AMBAM